MKKNCSLQKYLYVTLFIFSLQFCAVAQSYNFESDIAGNAPANITATNGTITTDNDVSRTNTMNPLTAAGNTASFNMDLFPSDTDYSVT